MTAAAFPTFSVEVAFANNPFDSSLTWTDITRYVQGFATTMGRQHELQQVNPSTAKITLWNGPTGHGDTTGGRFSPWNTGSAYYHSGTGLIPTKPVRIQATYSSTTYNVFYGYVDNWTPGYGQTSSLMTLNCSDILKLLNLNTLDTSQYEAFPLITANNYYPLSDVPGSASAVDLVGATNAIANGVSFGEPGPFESNAALTSAAVTNDSSLTVGHTLIGSSAFSVEGWINSNGANTATVYQTDTGTINLGTSYLTGDIQFFAGGGLATGSNVCDGNWHYVVGTYDGTTVSVYVDGQLSGTASGSGSASPGDGALAETSAGASFAQIALYLLVLTPTQIADQYQIGLAGFIVQDSGSRINVILETAGVPSALNNVGTGEILCQAATSSLSTTTAMSYLNTVVNTERGLLYQDGTGVVQFRNRGYVYSNSPSKTSQATFGYASGQLHYYATSFVPATDDIDTWNNIPVQSTNGAIQTVSDSASITLHGRRTLTGYTNLLFVDDSDSLALAEGLLLQYKGAQTRVRALTVDNLISAGAALPQMLGRQLLDRVTINWRPLDGSSVDFSQQSLIEQVAHTVDAQSRTWTTTFAVTPIGTEVFFLLNSATEGILNTNELGF
jgi:hypothetical protein